MSDAQKLMTDVQRNHRWKGRSLAPSRCTCGATIRDLEEHRSAEIDKALGVLTQERRDADDCDCGNEHHPSWCDDDCVRFDPDKAKSRWVSEWSESKP
ncbi:MULTISPECIES: hypothetical protein [Mycolicibacterium]|jgi:hypothetical protein|uniref:Uncharacterized protein n=3 Tax=Mycolicibacterium TaxID=1866885 RepID=A0AAE4VIP9_MYCFO|nr:MULTISPECIES: hypothetical protein [Mycolicibacterium]KLI04532.1 hypothetical protein AA982_29550 [Mycolicibacterium senegalense]KLO53824.1 hypothetical protein ABW05_22380 [Mycolicibacterium senegalense]KMV16364.1 hypothetical protein ACT17_20585 [Mycolicibacterium conceptionense]MDV7194319.1 hypothetical protein [Mycolicibacterium fortuitum]MDV7294262.1 hypothetical protein [Mycolicibacterium fortuitum]